MYFLAKTQACQVPTAGAAKQPLRSDRRFYNMTIIIY
jgi:hypothetical protein